MTPKENWDWPAIRERLQCVVDGHDGYKPIGFVRAATVTSLMNFPSDSSNLFAVLMRWSGVTVSAGYQYAIGWTISTGPGWDSCFVSADKVQEALDAVLEGWIPGESNDSAKETYGAKCVRCLEYYEHAVQVAGFRCYGCRMCG